MEAKNIIEFRIEFPSGTEKELKESFSEILKDFELTLRFSLARKLVEEKGLDKEVGERLAEDIRIGVAKRLGL